MQNLDQCEKNQFIEKENPYMEENDERGDFKSRMDKKSPIISNKKWLEREKKMEGWLGFRERSFFLGRTELVSPLLSYE